MGHITVCPLGHVASALQATGAGSVVSLLAPEYRLPPFPESVSRHLHLLVADIVQPLAGHVLAGADEMSRLLVFLHAWDRRSPLLIHCYAGVSRSTAAAFVALCALDPTRPEREHARRLRRASPTATPNPRLVALADDALARGGRMIEAVASIGRGAACYEGNVFTLDLPPVAADAERTVMR